MAIIHVEFFANMNRKEGDGKATSRVGLSLKNKLGNGLGLYAVVVFNV